MRARIAVAVDNDGHTYEARGASGASDDYLVAFVTGRIGRGNRIVWIEADIPPREPPIQGEVKS